MTTKTQKPARKDLAVSLDLVDKVLEGFDETAPDIVLPVLRRTQEVYGFIPEPVVFELARRMKRSPAMLYGVATFYDQFNMEPKGDTVVRLCTNVACNILRAEDLLEHLEDRLKVKRGGTTPDGKYTLLEVECIGSCGEGPAMMVNDDFHYGLTEDKIDEILKRY